MPAIIPISLSVGDTFSFHHHETDDESQNVSVIVLDRWNNSDDYAKQHSDECTGLYAYFYMSSLFVAEVYASSYGIERRAVAVFDDGSIVNPIIYQVLMGNKKVLLSGTNINIYNKLASVKQPPI